MTDVPMSKIIIAAVGDVKAVIALKLEFVPNTGASLVRATMILEDGDTRQTVIGMN